MDISKFQLLVTNVCFQHGHKHPGHTRPVHKSQGHKRPVHKRPGNKRPLTVYFIQAVFVRKNKTNIIVP